MPVFTRRLLPSLALALALSLAACVEPPPDDPHEQARAVTRTLMSPFCPGLLLADCPSPNAADLRREIERRITAGEAPGAVADDLEARFGSAIRGVPPTTGFGMVFWIVPVLVAAGGAAVVGGVVRRSVHRAGLEPDRRTGPPASGRLADRLEDELADVD